jgi:hypothetical protein
MGYYLQIDEDVTVPIGSIKGWGDVIGWAQGLHSKDYATVRHLCRFGWQGDVEGLSDELDDALKNHAPYDATVLKTVKSLSSTVSKHKDAVVCSITDGLSPDSDEDDTKSRRSTPGKNMNTMATMTKTKRLKSVPITEGRFEGNTLVCWPSVMGVMDLYGDVIFPGAFKGCLDIFMRRGFVPTDHQWAWTSIVAIPTVAEERGNKLYSECVFHSDQNSQDALTKCKERMALGKECGQSIGFTMSGGDYLTFDNGKALLAYAKKEGYDLKLFDIAGISACTESCCAIINIEELWEYSLTPVPANQSAMAIAVKSMQGVSLGVRDAQAQTTPRVTREGNRGMRIKSICGARGLALADHEMKWSAKDAIKRIKDHTKTGDEPNAAFAKAFIACDGPTDEFGSYKLPFADIVDGEMKAVPKGIVAAAGALDGARGGVELSDADHESAKRFVESYYAKMDMTVPWTDDSSEKSFKGVYLGDYVERKMCLSALETNFYALYYEVSDALGGFGDYKDMDADSIYDCMDGMHDEFKDLNMAITRAIYVGNGAESATDAAAGAKRRLVSIMSSLGDGLGYTRHAQLAVDAAVQVTERTKGRADMRLKEGRALSEANRSTLKDHASKLEALAAEIKQLLADTDPKANDEEMKALELEFRRIQISPLANDAAAAILAAAG